MQFLLRAKVFVFFLFSIFCFLSSLENGFYDTALPYDSKVMPKKRAYRTSFSAAAVRRAKTKRLTKDGDSTVSLSNAVEPSYCVQDHIDLPTCSKAQNSPTQFQIPIHEQPRAHLASNSQIGIAPCDSEIPFTAFENVIATYGLDSSLSELSDDENGAPIPDIYRKLLNVGSVRSDGTSRKRVKPRSPFVLASLWNSPVCEFCGAYRFSLEPRGFCCLNGKLAQISLPPNVPEPLASLYKDSAFLNNIRSYNNVLALASISCNETRLDGFSPIVKVHGKIHHFVGPLMPNPGANPIYAQLYFCDTVNEWTNRCNLREGLNHDTIRSLQDFLHDVNPHVKSIKYAASRMSEAPALDVILRSDGTKTTELPTEDTVAGLIDQKSVGNRLNVVLETQSGQLKRISEMNRLYDPLHYILLFPYGGNGYHTGIVNSLKKSVSASKYCRYLIQVRPPHISGNYLVRSRRLFQQYVIDQFVKQESYRMAWYRSHQKELRAEKYSGLLDAASRNDEVQPGKRILLPPTHYGSPRWYSEVFQDSMGIVRHYGKPDLFITMTCNPNWPEITDSLHEGETALDRPDVVCRVFNLKHEELIRTITKDRHFGKAVAFISMKEDQKRGLPHCHILLTLDKDSKPRNPEDVDKIISAEIPDKDLDPDLYYCVTTHNIHGPCGEIRHDARCMKKNVDGKCVCMKKFPKPFNNDGTEFVENAYPRYKRTDILHGGGVTYRTVQGRVYTIDNSWVVPYNKELTTKFNCHINVEVVSTVGAVKYICLYLTKGTDKTLYSLLTEEHNGVVDEISNFQVARYINAQEAMWRTFEFDILKKYPPVQKLAVHLPDQQSVVFEPSTVDQVLAEGPPATSLTAYLDLNTECEEARQYVYPQICQYYRLVGKKWVKRQRKKTGFKEDGGPLSDTIGRMPVINFTPRQTELYYLRLLLHHIPGPTSYSDLRTVNDIMFATYREACLKLGLIRDDTECDQAMNEAATVQFGRSLRELFSTLLVYGELGDPVQLWENHKDQLADDIAFRNGRQGNPNFTDFAQTLAEIQQFLDTFEMKLDADFGFKIPINTPTNVPTRSNASYDTDFLFDLSTTNLRQMTDDQLHIYNSVMNSVDNDQGTCFLLNSAGGTGKTFIVTTILASIRAKKQTAIATAVSGIAATLLPDGRTLHSKLNVPVDFDEFSMCSISSNGNTAQELRSCKLLVVDEVTMAHRFIFEAVDRSLRDITGLDRLFGGITVLLSGDWRQILPVVKFGGQADIINACLKNSYIWSVAVKLTLSKNMRLVNSDSSNKRFSEYLLDVGDGRVSPVSSDSPDMIPIPLALRLKDNTLSALCDFVFEDLENNFASPEWICSRGVLTPTNEAVEEINKLMTQRYPGIMRIYRSADSLSDDSLAFQYPVEYLNSITPSGMPTHELHLKVGLPVMLLRNLDPPNHHCNGTRYVITQMHEHVLQVAIASGPKVGLTRFIPRIALKSTDKTLPFSLKRVQFPLKVCFGLTMNKSQGQSFSKVGIYLKRDVFAHGQLYVALSRVRDSQAVKVLPCISNPDSMKNIVYKDIVAM